MPDTYYIVCIDCGQALDVGKLILRDMGMQERLWAFGGSFGLKHSTDVGELFDLLSYFLILHRGHEIRLLSDTLLNEVDPDGWLCYYDDVNELYSQMIAPIPDGEEDARLIPLCIKEMLHNTAETNRVRLHGDWDKPRM